MVKEIKLEHPGSLPIATRGEMGFLLVMRGSVPIREFKKRTGQTVHSCILQARLDLCRSFIEQGYSITQVCRMGGFDGYNHFFKAFRKVYGMTPKEYYRAYPAQSKPG